MSEEQLEDGGMDQLLRGAMTEPAPDLSTAFDRNLKRRIDARHRQLTPQGRRWLGIYAVVSVLVSILAMRAAGMEWISAAAWTLLPALLLSGVVGIARMSRKAAPRRRSFS